MITDFCQRWRDRRGVYRPAGEPFDPRAFEVAAIGEDGPAKAFVEAHHYSGSYPVARRRFGLYQRDELVGVAVYSQPMNDASLRPFTRDDAAELGRLVLLDRVGANAESWFVARTFELLRGDLGAVVSLSDPEPRTTAAGGEVFRGHIGTVYQALSARYTGRSTPRTQRLLPDGSVLNDRALQKVRARERGWRYVVRQLVEAGVPEPVDDDLAAWLRAELPRVTRSRRHPGNHRYVFPLSRSARRAAPASLPYPKFDLFGRAA